MKKVILFVLALVMTFVLALGVTIAVGATESEDVIHNGTWGDLSWTLNETTGELVISGEGEMNGFSDSSTDAWRNYKEVIQSVVIEEGVKSIGQYAFHKCSNLQSVIIGNSVATIDWYAFYSCSNLQNITIGNGVTYIGKQAFYNCDMSDITIPNKVTTIGESAFSGCYNLKNVTISDSVTTMGDYVFSACISLENVKIGNSVKRLGMGVFINCGSLKNVTIPNSVTSIGYNAFASCGSLTRMTIPNSVTSIDVGAFIDCRSLTNITIGSGVTSIGGNIFSGCKSLTSIVVDSNNLKYCSKGNCLIDTQTKALIGGCQSSVIPTDGSVKTISAQAFHGSIGLDNIIIPDGVTSIGDAAFFGCSGLKSVTIPDSVTNIGERAFSDCSNLISITLPNGITSIEYSMFSGCSSLTHITISKNVTSIDNYAFNGCSSLISVTLPKGLVSIGERAFYGCSSLANVMIPDGVTRIGNDAFNKCSTLMSVIMSKSVITIGNNAFYNCKNLKNVVFCGTAEEWDAIEKGTKWNVYDDFPNGDKTIDYTLIFHQKNAHGYCELCQVKITGASITIGKDLTMNYFVDLMDETLVGEGQTLAMAFTMHQKTVTVLGVYDEKSGEYIFSFEGIAPQCMGDLIDAAVLVLDEEGQTVATIASKNGYSIKANAEALLTKYSDDTALAQLVTDMLTYGAAAQTYRGYKTDELVNADMEGTPSAVLPTKTEKKLETHVQPDAVKFTSSTVWFDYINKIGVKLSAVTENTRLLVNGEEVVIENNAYFTDAIYATKFDDVYVFELYEGEAKIQTLTYSISSYVYAMMGKVDAETGEPTAMASLAMALYRYGASASSYAASVQ